MGSVSARARRLGKAATAVAAVLTLAASASLVLAAPAGAAKKHTDWRVGYADPIDFKANIFHAFNASPYFIFSEVYDTLLNYDRNGNPDPAHAIAARYTVSPDGKTYTFYLHHDRHFADGTPVTADDVAWSWNKDSKSQVNSGYVTYLKKAVAVNRYEVKILLTKPDARIPSDYVVVLPKHIWSKIPDSKLADANPCCPMIGTGPFTVKSIDPKGTTVLVPSKHFYGPKGQITRILMVKYGDKEAALRDLKLGNLDAILDGDERWVRGLRSSKQIKTWPAPGPGFQEIAFNSCPASGTPNCSAPGKNVHVKVVQDPAIRHAIAWGIDRKNLAATAYSGVALPAYGIISPYFAGKGYFKDWSTDPTVGYRYDPSKARAILAAGGWKCPAGGVCQKGGTKAEFELLVRSEDQSDQNAARRVQAWARNLGIKIDVSVVTTDAINNRIYNTSSTDKNKYQPTYDAFLWDWGGDVATPDYNFEVLECANTSSDSMYCNHRYDKLVDASLSETNRQKRIDDMHAAEKLVLQDSPYVFLVHRPSVYVTRNDTWKGYFSAPGPKGGPFSVSWLQLQSIVPVTGSASGGRNTVLIVVAALVVLALIAAAVLRGRRRERAEPLELPE